jgi:hypothetical protein
MLDVRMMLAAALGAVLVLIALLAMRSVSAFSRRRRDAAARIGQRLAM